jgi:hypothetical protein
LATDIQDFTLVLQRTVLAQHPAQYSLKLMVGQKQLVNQER